MIYLAFAITGFFVGIIGATVKVLEYWFIRAKVGYATEIMNSNGEERLWLGWFYFLAIACTFAFIAAVLSIYVAPASQGSGIPQMMGTFNGVSLPELFTMDTWLAKVIGLMCA